MSRGTTGGGRPNKRRLDKRRLDKRHKESSRRWITRQLNDPYVAQARRLGYRSRAAFKLKEIDDRHRFLRAGQTVLDLGAAPGGWCQIVLEHCPGSLVAVDRAEMEPLPKARILRLDLSDPNATGPILAALGGPADVVLSDMAAPTTGHAKTDHLRTLVLAELAFDMAERCLGPGGAFLTKIFQGGADQGLLTACRRAFSKVRHIKPPASRDGSPELYLLATGFRRPGAGEGPTDS